MIIFLDIYTSDEENNDESDIIDIEEEFHFDIPQFVANQQQYLNLLHYQHVNNNNTVIPTVSILCHESCTIKCGQLVSFFVCLFTKM